MPAAQLVDTVAAARTALAADSSYFEAMARKARAVLERQERLAAVQRLAEQDLADRLIEQELIEADREQAV